MAPDRPTSANTASPQYYMPSMTGPAYDVIIIGAGAAGLLCARECVLRGLRVLVLEGGEKTGRKLCLAGGGKANFSNRDIAPCHYHSSLPNACQHALRGFPTRDILRLVEGWSLPYEERKHGQLFLRTAALKLRDALLRDCTTNGCDIVCRAPVSRIWQENEWFCVASNEHVWTAKGVGLATGSPACPQCGANASGYKLARQLGHTIIPHRPALAPLLMPHDWPSATLPCAALAGICLPVRISLPEHPGMSWQDDLLFTHEGISGPAVLKASLFWEVRQMLEIDFAPDANVEQLCDTQGKSLARTIVRRIVPQRLADALLPPALADRKCAELSRGQRQSLAASIHAHKCLPLRTAGLKQAEACNGGVDMREVNSRSMESTLTPHLWFMGEVLDVTGLLGGYNLHWAWASAMAAARSMAKTFGAQIATARGL